MKPLHTPLIIGNWKMNPATKQSAVRLYKDVHKGIARVNDVSVVVAPPTVFLSVLGGSKKPLLAAQNVHWDTAGRHTGEVSIGMLKDAQVTHVIIGHSERRAEGETNEEINKKVHTTLKAGFTTVVCIGERKRDSSGRYLNTIEKQISSACAGVSKSKLPKLVIAYEPIWAISSGDGKGKTATPDDAHEMKIFIQKTLMHIYDRKIAMKVRVLYGGSVNSRNAAELLEGGVVDGFLIGGASLKPDEFIEIVKIAHAHVG